MNRQPKIRTELIVIALRMLNLCYTLLHATLKETCMGKNTQSCPPRTPNVRQKSAIHKADV